MELSVICIKRRKTVLYVPVFPTDTLRQLAVNTAQMLRGTKEFSDRSSAPSADQLRFYKPRVASATSTSTSSVTSAAQLAHSSVAVGAIRSGAQWDLITEKLDTKLRSLGLVDKNNLAMALRRDYLDDDASMALVWEEVHVDAPPPLMAGMADDHDGVSGGGIGIGIGDDDDEEPF
ncbi:hypothetical protein GQ42DRAFT_3774 [Ramicandelaber brevisporus]|nr:hypothetical protein GQ42DRAFT_3774 [Ramicandelaber brevisporus]